MELAASAGAEPRDRHRYETAGENLQDDAVLMMRPRVWLWVTLQSDLSLA